MKIHINSFISIPLLYIISILSNGCQSTKEKVTTNMTMSEAMVISEIKRNPQAWMLDFQQKPKWAYVNGQVCLSILKVWEATGNQAYFDYVKGYADSLIDVNGQIIGYKKSDFNLDKLNSGKILFALYKETGDERYKLVLETLREQIEHQPRTMEGGFWHKTIYPNQMWLDGLYMGTPFYAEYAATFGDSTAWDDIALQFSLLHEHARDSITGWYYHGWDASHSAFWSNPMTGCSKNFWARGIGWYYMALVDVLDFFPENHPKRDILISYFQELSETIVKNQDEETGVWYQVPNMPKRAGNYLEATGSTMFTYGIAKGIAKEYLKSDYIQPVKKAYQGILEHLIKVHSDGEVELLHCCAGAGLGPESNSKRDGTYEYYIHEATRSNDGKGTAPFIAASLILEKNLKFKE